MKSRPHFQQASNPSMCSYRPRRRPRHPTQQLQQCTLPRSIFPYNSDYITLVDLEVDVAEGPDVVGGAFGSTIVGLADLEVRIFFSKNIRDPKSSNVMR